jgi:hypothetical protein
MSLLGLFTSLSGGINTLPNTYINMDSCCFHLTYGTPILKTRATSKRTDHTSSKAFYKNIFHMYNFVPTVDRDHYVD